MGHRHRANRSSSGVFFIGLALLFVTGWWFPGILFVMGASLLAGAIDHGKPWQSATPALVLFGIGLVFGFPTLIHAINWKMIAIVILVVFAWSMLFGKKSPTYPDDSIPDDDEDDSHYV